MVTIIDYGAGNLRSVVNAIARLGYQSKITNQADDVLAAQALILPGVGAAGDTMANLKQRQLTKPIIQYIWDGRPFLGICIGLQMLLTGTEEGGWHDCLNVIPGKVKRLPDGQKIPHMGWNQVKQVLPHPVFNGIPDETNFYFVHSYYAEIDDESSVIGITDYGTNFCSAIAQGNLVATQFHPERSGEHGLRIYDNFLKLALKEELGRKTGEVI
ncbi:MAG TPA: imidazole glycerol phosphate synthase subunit HisH [Dehalococcoidia bacterium]|nr:imidazole glycerol phosphate synthase subunit HisH [Dehalococcoidia bacterium]